MELACCCSVPYLPAAQSVENSEPLSAAWSLPSFSVFLSASSACDTKETAFPRFQTPTWDCTRYGTRLNNCAMAGRTFFSTGLAPVPGQRIPEPKDHLVAWNLRNTVRERHKEGLVQPHWGQVSPSPLSAHFAPLHQVSKGNVRKMPPLSQLCYTATRRGSLPTSTCPQGPATCHRAALLTCAGQSVANSHALSSAQSAD